MCWLTQDALKMRAAEIVTFRSKQGSDVSEKIVVADDEVTSNAVIRGVLIIIRRITSFTHPYYKIVVADAEVASPPLLALLLRITALLLATAVLHLYY